MVWQEAAAEGRPAPPVPVGRQRGRADAEAVEDETDRLRELLRADAVWGGVPVRATFAGVERIEVDVEVDAVDFLTFPPRPKGMHRRTYESIRALAEQADRESLLFAAARFRLNLS